MATKTEISSHMGYAMTQLGFEGDPSKWVGKTIAKVETLRAEYGATFDTCVLFLFEDGSRGWLVGRGSANGIMTGPLIEEVAKSLIVTADEYGRMQAAHKRLRDEKAAAHQSQKLAEFERLKKELGAA